MDEPASKSEPVAPQEQQQAYDVQKRPKHKRVHSDDTERPASAQRNHRDSSIERSDIEAELDHSDDEGEPSEPIRDFYWQDLHERYHAAINQCNQEEVELMHEWSGLMEVLWIRTTTYMSND